MSYQEFIIAFETLISGFAAARFFRGWGEMIKYRRKYRYYWGHTLITIIAFFILIQQWWGAFQRDPNRVTTIWEFVLLLSIPATFYFMAIQFFPVYKGQQVNLRAYFMRNRVAYGLCFLTYFAILSFSHIYYGQSELDARSITRLGGIVLSLVVIFTRNRRILEGVLVLAGIMVFLFFTYVEQA